MKLIIDIDDKDKKICEQYINNKLGDELGDYVNITELADAIANGIPLPKGHDNLMDIDAILMIKYGKTIIEADKENNDETDN